jgi:hypothetical protein
VTAAQTDAAFRPWVDDNLAQTGDFAFLNRVGSKGNEGRAAALYRSGDKIHYFDPAHGMQEFDLNHLDELKAQINQHTGYMDCVLTPGHMTNVPENEAVEPLRIGRPDAPETASDTLDLTVVPTSVQPSKRPAIPLPFRAGQSPPLLHNMVQPDGTPTAFRTPVQPLKRPAIPNRAGETDRGSKSMVRPDGTASALAVQSVANIARLSGYFNTDLGDLLTTAMINAVVRLHDVNVHAVIDTRRDAQGVSLPPLIYDYPAANGNRQPTIELHQVLVGDGAGQEVNHYEYKILGIHDEMQPTRLDGDCLYQAMGEALWALGRYTAVPTIAEMREVAAREIEADSETYRPAIPVGTPEDIQRLESGQEPRSMRM